MKDSKGHGSDPRGTTRGSGEPYTTPTVQEAARPGVRTPGGGFPAKMASDNLDTMKTIADLRARMSGTGPGHQAALGQGISNLQGGIVRDLRGVSSERRGR